MSLKIRLARTRGKPFRIVAADVRAPRDGKFKYNLGYYNPVLNCEPSDKFKIDLEKAEFLISQGAQVSKRVAKLMSLCTEKNIIKR
ncbi:30S ribosomal protein S16 [Candidatus Fokinia solitaria]|uniref:30S ribosomal protein S16 n=1 Tax=Candidatus Fokinia solitaria TaxID=1802984 RepID=A0A2U8BST0_9RICK|nr:30S ribosomal protein S16 [Candidatus Fokinia solitaria]AWD33399.1 30S ribosomal protein S16 [Candidatus Fokinia solitaria]